MRGGRRQGAWTIAARDVRELWRDGRSRWLVVTLFGALITAGAAGLVQSVAAGRLQREAQRAERQLSLDRGEMNPHAAAHYGAFIFKPVEPLHAIDPGVDPYVGVVAFLEAHQQHAARYQPIADATPVRRLGELSLADAVQLLVPLLVVALSAGAVVGERERGTLAQLLGTGIASRTLILGKFIAVAVPLGIVIVPIAGVGLGAALAGGPAFDSDLVLRTIVLCGIYTAYVLFWFSVTLAVSARARTSGSALLLLLAIWFFVCLVAPRLAAAMAAAMHPAPTSASFALAVQEARAALPSWPDRVASVEERFLDGTLPLDPDMPSNPEVIALVDTERDESALYERLFTQLSAVYSRQTEIYQRAGWLNPAIAVQSLSMAVAGTDYGFHRRFVEATRAYREEFLQLLNAELVSYREINTFDYTRGRELWERIPPFEFSTPPIGDVLRDQRPSAAALLIWTLAALASARLLMRRLTIQ